MTKGWEKTAEEAELTLWLPGEVPMYFREIPAGRFRIGSRGYKAREEPMTEVVFSDSFYMAAFPVTQHQWRAVVKAMDEEYREEHDLSLDPSHFKRGDLLPVEQVSWNDTQAWMSYVRKHQLLFRLENGEGKKVSLDHLRLPCEVEWEYACRAETETEYHSGDGEAALREVGWYDGNSGSETHSVGEKDANANELYDMHANVWEWCEDIWGDPFLGDNRTYQMLMDGAELERVKLEPNGDTYRVRRGGSWYGSAGVCRSAFRRSYWSGGRFGRHGFRVGLFPGPV